VRRSAFAPSPYPLELPALAAHPGLLLVAFALLSLAIGLAWTPGRLVVAAVGVLALTLWPEPSPRPLRVLAGFVPLLVLVPVFHLLAWRGFGGEARLPWTWDASALSSGFISAARMALWILISARVIGRLHPAAFLARLPARPRLARSAIPMVLALSFLDLLIREAWLLERARRARGLSRGGARRALHWPALLLPLFRNVLARADTLADALVLRRFPERWAGHPLPRASAGDLFSAALALAALLAVLMMGGS